MTLSIGNQLRKVEADGVTPVPSEGHSLFEVIGYGTIYEPNADGSGKTVTIAKLKPLN